MTKMHKDYFFLQLGSRYSLKKEAINVRAKLINRRKPTNNKMKWNETKHFYFSVNMHWRSTRENLPTIKWNETKWNMFIFLLICTVNQECQPVRPSILERHLQKKLTMAQNRIYGWYDQQDSDESRKRDYSWPWQVHP